MFFKKLSLVFCFMKNFPPTTPSPPPDPPVLKQCELLLLLIGCTELFFPLLLAVLPFSPFVISSRGTRRKWDLGELAEPKLLVPLPAEEFAMAAPSSFLLFFALVSCLD